MRVPGGEECEARCLGGICAMKLVLAVEDHFGRFSWQVMADCADDKMRIEQEDRLLLNKIIRADRITVREMRAIDEILGTGCAREQSPKNQRGRR